MILRSAFVTSLGVLAIVGLFSCTSSPSPGPGGTGKITAYVSCASGTATCPDSALCTTDKGVSECVALPAACDGEITCACLDDAFCVDASCADGAAAGTITCDASGDDDCTPGVTFPSPDGCNTCSCPPSGKKSDAACTAMGCVEPCDGRACGDVCTPPGTNGQDSKAAMPIETGYCNVDSQCVYGNSELGCVGNDVCTPGESFPSADGCNTCTCGPSGKKVDASCTEMACDPCDGKACGESCQSFGGGGGAEMPIAPAYCNGLGQCVIDDPGNLGCTGGSTCTPGESFLADDGCNNCLCPANGKRDEASCTDMACPPGPCTGKKCGESCTPCPAGQSCLVPILMVCDLNGECVDGSAVVVECDPDACVPGEAFPAADGCNTCTCGVAGKKSESGCTKIGCPVMCGGGEPAVFPQPLDTCIEDSDCAIVLHQIDCCGTLQAWGIAGAGVKDFETSEAVCQAQYPDCKCAQFQTTSDDGSKGWNADDFVAICSESTCRSQGATGCHAGLACQDSMFCLSPGESMGCGMCWDPEEGGAPTCADDTSCQGSDPTAICVESTPADCLCSPAKLCKLGCTSSEGCAEGETCQPDKHCTASACTADTGCPTNFSCVSASCARRSCEGNADCDGFCVNGRCHGNAGTCSYPVP